jgi:hypothetical protein
MPASHSHLYHAHEPLGARTHTSGWHPACAARGGESTRMHGGRDTGSGGVGRRPPRPKCGPPRRPRGSVRRKKEKPTRGAKGSGERARWGVAGWRPVPFDISYAHFQNCETQKL